MYCVWSKVSVHEPIRSTQSLQVAGCREHKCPAPGEVIGLESWRARAELGGSNPRFLAAILQTDTIAASAYGSMGIAGRSASFFRSVPRTVRKNDGTGKQYLLAGLRNGERSHNRVSMTAQVVPKCADAPLY